MPPASPETSIDEVLEAMRAAGGRITVQRRLVLDALVATQPHPSADDVTAYVQRSSPDVHQSTVYRTLHALTDLGVISHVHLSHGRSVYHFTHDAAPHLVCRSCSAVTHLDADTFAAVRELVVESTGFELEHGHFAWTASCPICRASDEPDTPGGSNTPAGSQPANE